MAGCGERADRLFIVASGRVGVCLPGYAAPVAVLCARSGAAACDAAAHVNASRAGPRVRPVCVERGAAPAAWA